MERDSRRNVSLSQIGQKWFDDINLKKKKRGKKKKKREARARRRKRFGPPRG